MSMHVKPLLGDTPWVSMAAAVLRVSPSGRRLGTPGTPPLLYGHPQQQQGVFLLLCYCCGCYTAGPTACPYGRRAKGM